MNLTHRFIFLAYFKDSMNRVYSILYYAKGSKRGQLCYDPKHITLSLYNIEESRSKK